MSSSLNILGVTVPYFGEVPVSTNFVIADVREPGSRNGTYTKTIKVPGTHAVNLIFEFVFELNIQLATFNPNKAALAIFYTNDIEAFRGGLQIMSIDVDYSTGVHQLIYNCQITGQTGDLWQAIAGKFLTDIDFSDLNHTFVYSAGLFTPAVPGTGYGYGFIDYGLNNGNSTLWRFQDLKPYIFELEYVKRIFRAAGKTFTSTFLNSFDYKNIVISDCDEGALKLAPAQITLRQFYAGKTTNTVVGPSAGTAGISVWSYPILNLPIFIFNDDSTTPFNDPGNMYNTATGFATYAADSYNQITAVFNYRVRFTAPAGTTTANVVADVNAVLTLNGTVTPLTVTNGISGSYNVVAGVVDITQQISVTYPSQLFTAASTVSAGISVTGITGLPNAVVQFLNGGTPVVSGTSNIQLDISSGTFYSTLTDATLPLNTTLIMGQTIPKDVKQLDFLKSIFLAHNLYMELDKTTPNNYIIEPRDQFILTNGTGLQDWTQKQDLLPGYEVIPMGELNARTYFLKYKEDKDTYNQQYQDEYKETYGQARYDVDNDFITQQKIIELIFSATPGVSIGQSDIVAPRFYTQDGTNIKPTKVNIRRLYYGGMRNCNTYRLAGIDYTIPTISIPLSSYPYLGHINNPSTPTYDLSFSAPRKLYYILPNQTYTTNNLRNIHWKKYFDEITDKDSKILRTNILLTEEDIRRFSFRNMIFINGTYFFVNKISDYDPQVRKSCIVELLKLKAGIVPPTVQYVPFDPPSGVNLTSTVNPNFNYLGNYTSPGNIAAGKKIVNLGGPGIVSGQNVTIGSAVTDFDGIGLSTYSVTAAMSGKSVVRNGALIASNNGIETMALKRASTTVNISWDPGTPVQFVDASGTNVIVKLPKADANKGMYTLIRLDNSANTVTVNGELGTELIIANGVSSTSDLVPTRTTRRYTTNFINWYF